jgi:uncharacterized membrane protein
MFYKSVKSNFAKSEAAHLLMGVSALLILQACAFHQDKAGPLSSPGNPQSAHPNAPTLSVGFKEVNEQIISKSCLECHSSRHPVLTSYENVIAALPQIQRAVLVDKIMPPAQKGPLSSDQLSLLQNWIDAKAPQEPVVLNSSSPPTSGPNSPTGTASPSPTPSGTASGTPPRVITWTQLKKEVVDLRCASCHYEKNPKGLIDLTKVKVFKDSIGTIMYATLIEKDTPMPPKQRGPLTVDQKKLLTDWIIDGQVED